MKTPQQSFPELALALHVPELWLKREDLHPLLSHKGRSIPFLIKEHFKKNNTTSFVISSSGNAALAAILFIKKYNKNTEKQKLSLQIFVGMNIDEKKFQKLKKLTHKEEYIVMEQTKNPKQSAFLAEKNNTAHWLRQSTDPLALLPYEELAEELSKIPNLQAVFVPTSSGTTAEGLFSGFKKIGNIPQIHIAQTTACHPIAEFFTSSKETTTNSLAKAIVDTIAHRKQKVIEAVQTSGGSGFIISDDELKEAKEITKKMTGIDISYNSALSIAALQKAVKEGRKFTGAVVCLVTGE